MGVGVWSLCSHNVFDSSQQIAKMVQMIGSYVRETEEKNGDFLSKLGVGFVTRKAAMASTPTMDISGEGGKWKMVTATRLTKVEVNFELGVAFDEKTADGRQCKTTVTKEGDNKLVTKQIAQKDGQKDVTVIREFTDAGIDVQFICEDVTSVQHFKRQ